MTDYIIEEDLIPEEQPSTSNDVLEIKRLPLMSVDKYDWSHSFTNKKWISFSYISRRLLPASTGHLNCTQCCCRAFLLVKHVKYVYSALSVEQSADYEVVKREILECIVPEAYCQQLRELKCKEGQTYMEFARQKEALFNRWCTSQQVGNSFDKLKQLVLLEEV